MTKRNSQLLDKPASGVYITGEYASPTSLARGKLAVMGIGALVCLSICALGAMLIFREVLAPVILWVGVTSGTASVLFILIAGLLKLKRHFKQSREIDQLSGLEIQYRTAEVDKLEMEALQERYKAQRLALEAIHLQKRLSLVTFAQSEGLFNLETGSITYIPRKVEQLEPPEPEPEESLDLLEVFTQAYMVYAIIGGQRSGKTTQAQNIAIELQSKPGTLRPVVIAPKMEPGEWPGCKTIIGRRRILEQGMRLILEEVDRRHSDKKSSKSFPFLPIFLDDWSNIVNETDLGREFIFQASTLFTSANIILYFILHSDTRPAWGVDDKGAALKDAFVKLFVEPYRINGIVQPGQSRGFITFPNSKERIPVELLPPPVYSPDKQEPEPESWPEEQLPDPEPTQEEQEDELFIRLVREGQSRNQASLEAYGRSYAGNLVTRGKQALGEL